MHLSSSLIMSICIYEVLTVVYKDFHLYLSCSCMLEGSVLYILLDSK